MTWLDKILPLVGVIIGALLSPWIAHRVERSKDKLELKRNLLKGIHVFFNLWKESITGHNNRNLSIRFAFHISEYLSKGNLSEIQRNDQTRQYDTILKDIFNHDANLNSNYHKMMEVEADILANISIYKRFLNSSDFAKVSTYLRSIIERSNLNVELHNYEDLGPKEINELKQSLPSELKLRNMELDTECRRVVDKLLSVI